jgi:glutamate-ammonia-ligase adenylyltransferase
MALTRARVVAGDGALREKVDTEIAAILALPRDAAKIRRDAVEMRRLIASEKPPSGKWDLKLIPGGLIDLEFIAQVASLTGAAETDERLTGTADVLARLSPAFAEPQVRQDLTEALALYSALTQIIRLCLTGSVDSDGIPPGLADLLLARTDLPEMKVLEAHVGETAHKVRTHFDALLKGRRK